MLRSQSYFKHPTQPTKIPTIPSQNLASIHPKKYTQKQQLKNVTEIDYIFVDCKSVMILCTHLFREKDFSLYCWCVGGIEHLNVKKKKTDFFVCCVMDYSTFYAYKCEICFKRNEFQVQFNGNSLSWLLLLFENVNSWKCLEFLEIYVRSERVNNRSCLLKRIF